MTEHTKKGGNYLSIIILIISHSIIFLAGLFGRKFIINYIPVPDKYKNKAKNTNEINSFANSNPTKKTVTAYFHKKLQIIKNNPEPINNNDISINVQQQKMKKNKKA